jgi:hypothetical protein
MSEIGDDEDIFINDDVAEIAEITASYETSAVDSVSAAG